MRTSKDINYYFLIIINLILWSFLVFVLFNLQVVKFSYSEQKIENIFETPRTIIPKRGNIYVTDKLNNLYLVATVKKVYDVYYNPKLAKNLNEEINKIQTILNLKENIKISNSVVLLAKNIDQKTKEELSKLKYNSLFFEEKYLRYYPEKNFLSTLLGFASLDENNILKGQYGLEKFYDSILRGEPGIIYGVQKIQSDIPGADLILNIDYFSQKYAEKILIDGIKKYEAKGGLIVVLKTDGRLIAVAEYPNFDPNNYFEIKNYEIFQTKLTQNYEPGSVMKAITYFIGLDLKAIDPEDKYFDAGFVNINGWKISNFDRKGRGYITLGEALEQSLNTGAIYVENKIGHFQFLNYLKKLKFDQRPFVDLPNLTEGNLKNLEKPAQDTRDVYFATASFGHGISLSPLHLLMAFNTFANHGLIKSITIVKKIIQPDGTEKNNEPIVIDKIGKPQTFTTLERLLNGVTERGSGKYAKTEGYSIAGKTGSAFIPLENGKGYSDDVINTYVTYFPSKKPQFVILVRIDKPNQGLAMVTTVPLAKQMIDFLINYYNILPDSL